MDTDCVIIGFNDFPLEKMAAKAKAGERRSGDYAEIARNSYLVGGKRTDFCGLLNAECRRVLGFDPQLNAFELPSLGAFYLANSLTSRGLSAEVVNLFNTEKDRLDNLLADEPASVAVTTTYYVSPEPIQEVVAYVRERSPKTRVIVGGPFIAHLGMGLLPAEQEIIYRRLGADVYVTDGQGEQTLARAVRAIRTGAPLDDVSNLVIRQPGGKLLARTKVEPEANHLEENCIDWGRFPRESFTPVTFMRTSRSCPFSCAFCNYPALGGPHQVMPVEPVLREMRQLYEMGTRYLVFIDDTFNVPPSRFKALLRAMIAERLEFRWVSFFRCSHVDDECFDLMQRSGCLAAYLGIESGDERVLRAMNKYATAEQYRQGLRRLHEHGIMSFGSFITGHPGETRMSVGNTLDFIEETAPTYFNTQMFFMDPTAPIAKRREEFELVGNHYSWRHKTMSWEEASELTNFTLRSVTRSIQLPLYGFSIWSIPYLLTKGFTLDEVKTFASAAHGVMVKSLGDRDELCMPEQSQIARILHAWISRRQGGRSEAQ